MTKIQRTRMAMAFGLSLMLLCVAPKAEANDFDHQVPSEAALRTKMALKLAGLVTFVASSCPDLKADYPRFKAAIGALGVSYEDLSKIEMKNIYLGYAMRYKDETKENCARALTNFGPAGKVVPDMLATNKPQKP